MQTHIQDHKGIYIHIHTLLSLTLFLFQITTSIDKKLQVDAHYTRSQIKMYFICTRPYTDTYWIQNVLSSIYGMQNPKTNIIFYF